MIPTMINGNLRRPMFLALGLLAAPIVTCYAQSPAPNESFRQTFNLSEGFWRDALRFSSTRFGGTARFQGLAGANTAVGGDVSAALVNPAGLGLMRRSEGSVSLTALSIGTNSTLGGEIRPINPNTPLEFTQFSDNRGSGSNFNLNINQFGVVFANDRGGDRDFRGGAFAINFARTNDFRITTEYSATNVHNSVIDNMLERTDNVASWDRLIRDRDRNDLYTVDRLGFAAYLIRPDFQDTTSRNSWESFIPRAPTTQGERIVRTGSQGQWNLSYGANYKDKLYLGVGVGIATLRYTTNRDYTEQVINSQTSGPNGTRLPLDNLLLRDRYTQEGTGVNASIGIIARPVNALRVGLSVTSPTFYRINDTYQSDLSVQYNNIRVTDFTFNPPRAIGLSQVSVSGPNDPASYNMRTPLRVNAGVMVLAGKQGFVSVDAEYVDHRTTNFSGSDIFNFERDRIVISTLYRAVVNLRAGGELRLKDFRVRGGYALYPNPVEPFNGEAPSVYFNSNSYLTGGLGWRKADYFFDLAVVYNSFNTAYRPYTLTRLDQGQPPVNPLINSTNNRLFVTLSGGFFF
jgi:hypothetical protein